MVADRQGAVEIGVAALPVGHKGFPRHAAHRGHDALPESGTTGIGFGAPRVRRDLLQETLTIPFKIDFHRTSESRRGLAGNEIPPHIPRLGYS